MIYYSYFIISCIFAFTFRYAGAHPQKSDHRYPAVPVHDENSLESVSMQSPSFLRAIRKPECYLITHSSAVVFLSYAATLSVFPVKIYRNLVGKSMVLFEILPVHYKAFAIRLQSFKFPRFPTTFMQ